MPKTKTRTQRHEHQALVGAAAAAASLTKQAAAPDQPGQNYLDQKKGDSSSLPHHKTQRNRPSPRSTRSESVRSSTVCCSLKTTWRLTDPSHLPSNFSTGRNPNLEFCSPSSCGVFTPKLFVLMNASGLNIQVFFNALPFLFLCLTAERGSLK